MQRITYPLIAAALTVLALAVARAQDKVPVPGSGTRFDATILSRIDGKDIDLNLTGTALRKKAIFSVYAIGSYLEKGVVVASPEELASRECAKQLHLVMERDVSGADMAKAFKDAIRMNYPGKEFEGELEGFAAFLTENPVKRGDRIVLTAVPAVGFRCTIAEKVECVIDSPDFARAIWEIYLGKNNLGDHIKKGLVSRLR